jgi:hypothetical protein
MLWETRERVWDEGGVWHCKGEDTFMEWQVLIIVHSWLRKENYARRYA